MKSRVFLWLLPGVVLIVGLTFIKCTQNNTEPDLWGVAYQKKCEDKRKGEPSNKEMTIKEIQKYFHDIKTKFGEETPKYPANYLMVELEKLKRNTVSLKSANDITWIQRGPGNVGGRTRSILLDPDDETYQTWYAGSATGGVWKTTTAGDTWEFISGDIPYLAISSLALSKSNPDVIYCGTGESFPGSMQTTGGGIFKSTDKGQTWSQLSFTASNEDFRYVNRIVVDPENENVVVAATTSGIYKSADGGTTWGTKYSSVYSVEDLKIDTSDFSTIFASEKSKGILRSVDGGETWSLSSSGIAAGYSRLEIAISPSNTDKVYCSANKSVEGSDVYVSWDKGNSWTLIVDDENADLDFLGGQGDYDNTIAVNPYYEDSVFVGGVNVWKIGVSSTTRDGEGVVTQFDTVNTSSFLDFIPFTGNLFPGMNIGENEDATDLLKSDYVSVEIRFGPGLSQKAHRFTVPANATSGVPASDYTYQDYVDVPFQVWDVTNNKQLMCSFRDQEADGEFNLYERTGENYGELGREYIFINAVDYDATNPNPSIATQGGRSYKLIYFFWPTLMEGGTWGSASLPDSKVHIKFEVLTERESQIVNVSDAYSALSKKNTYSQSSGFGKTSIPGFHPDHHVLVTVPVDPANKKFWILNGNDGGLGISYDNGETFKQIKDDIITTQFYGVSKKPYRNEYIGGMQDNGTWQSASFKNSSLQEDFYFRIGGDGFETAWNLNDTNKILASVYNNDIQRSVDHGKTWSDANSGIVTEDSPFLTKLTMLPSNPNKVFAIAKTGLYYTGNFATTSWRIKEIGDGWLPAGNDITSQHQVEYSIANDSIIWAGASAHKTSGYSIFVSTDQGGSFNQVNDPAYEMNAYVSGIATHPTEENTAYLLYSIYGEPKIMRTTDLGNTWEDITGFAGNTTSNNGFPDVGCLSLFVFPDTPNRIWAGTELGIVESLDNGGTWNILQSSLPTVPVWQIFLQDNQIVVATYGRGIWTYQYGEELFPPKGPSDIENTENSSVMSVYPNPTKGILNIEMKNGELKNSEIYIYNLSGQRLLSKTVNSREENITIDLSGFKKGYYLLSVRKNKGYVVTRKILLTD